MRQYVNVTAGPSPPELLSYSRPSRAMFYHGLWYDL